MSNLCEIDIKKNVLRAYGMDVCFMLFFLFGGSWYERWGKRYQHHLPKQSERELPSMGMAIWGGIDLNKSLNQYGIFQAKNSSYLVFFFKDVPGIGGGNMNVLISAFIFCVGFRIFLVWCKV